MHLCDATYGAAAETLLCITTDYQQSWEKGLFLRQTKGVPLRSLMLNLSDKKTG